MPSSFNVKGLVYVDRFFFWTSFNQKLKQEVSPSCSLEKNRGFKATKIPTKGSVLRNNTLIYICVECPFMFHPLVLSTSQIPQEVGLHWPSYSITPKHTILGAIFNHRNPALCISSVRDWGWNKILSSCLHCRFVSSLLIKDRNAQFVFHLKLGYSVSVPLSMSYWFTMICKNSFFRKLGARHLFEGFWKDSHPSYFKSMKFNFPHEVCCNLRKKLDLDLDENSQG